MPGADLFSILALEIGQGVLPTGRFMDLWDALANALGAGLGLAARQVLAYTFPVPVKCGKKDGGWIKQAETLVRLILA